MFVPPLLRLWNATPLWRSLLCALLLLVSWLALNPMPPPSANLGWDKLNHAAAFAALAFCTSRSRCGGMAPGLGALLAYGALIELVQSVVPGRQGELADLVADGLGALAGWLIALLLGRGLAAAAGRAQHP
ncbi:VanZ family protein [Aquabacterium sp. OR-4]|uniref:VanZ family protein n=1 Tax=Aquabacterium sp. OR-4 TaxID=2978127 RepID=UPI0021B207F4|nr:VanZ family protein [Aquabacterium sp. OR-4]MDT7835281.1 VanZ family protein [Aquabacterium sp. OR-4]